MHLRHPNAALLVPILTASDYIAVLPGKLAPHIGGNVQILNLPFPVPPYVIRQYWHERTARDPAVSWLRAEINRLVPDKLTHRAAFVPERNGVLRTCAT